MNRLPIQMGCLLALSSGWAAANPDFVNFIRQVQVPSGVQWDMEVPAASTPEGVASPLPVDTSGARFELWTVKNMPLTGYLLASQYVGAYVPAAEVTIESEDPYQVVPRTRADRPFKVTVAVAGLLDGAEYPESAKAVSLVRHVQAYEPGTAGPGPDGEQPLLLSQALIASNGEEQLDYTLTSVPAADRSKVWGEERFTVFSLADGQAPAGELASARVQVWPVSDGSISGLEEGAVVNFRTPTLTLTLHDLYPSSHTYAQVYRGAARLGAQGTVIPGSSLVVNDEVPQSRVLVVKDYGSVFDADGQWTIELLTETPFGVDRLAHLTFDLNLRIRVVGGLSTVE